MKESIKNLINKAKEVTSSGLPFMQGKEKDELTMGMIYNINEYGFLKGEEGEDFVVFTTNEMPGKFYYGGSVVTEKMKELEEALAPSEMSELLENGIEIVFIQKVSKNKKKYTNCEFFPSADQSK
jgi:hypothetical protein